MGFWVSWDVNRLDELEIESRNIGLSRDLWGEVAWFRENGELSLWTDVHPRSKV